MTFALLFERIGGRFPVSGQTPIPADESPVDELNAFLSVMDSVGAPYLPIFGSDSIAVQLEGSADELGQVWAVRIVAVGDDEETQEMEAVTLETDEVSK